MFIRACAERGGEGAPVPHAGGAEVVPVLAGSGGDGGAHVAVLVPAHHPR